MRAQLRILLKKNIIIKLGNPFETLAEFLFPLFSFLLLYLQPLIRDNAGQNFHVLGYYFIPFSCLCSTRFILMQMVLERQLKIRQSLQIMGLDNVAYGLSFFLV